MEHFDDIVTDPRLSLAQVEHHLSTVETGSYLFDRYTAITSGGSTGRRAVFTLQRLVAGRLLRSRQVADSPYPRNPARTD